MHMGSDQDYLMSGRICELGDATGGNKQDKYF